MTENRPSWVLASEADFAAVDLNAPLADSASLDCTDLMWLYRKAAQEAEKSGDAPAARVYDTMTAITSFQFRPEDKFQPFGNLFRSADQRSAIPDDFSGAPLNILRTNLERLSNLAVKARVADTIWLLDRKQPECGFMAVSAYGEIAYTLTSTLYDEEHTIFRAETYLRRALNITSMVGRDKPESEAVQSYAVALCHRVAESGPAHKYALLATLALDFQLSDPFQIAAVAETFAARDDDSEHAHRLWHISARAFKLGKAEDEANRCRLKAAECLVAVADKGCNSAMFAAHWLEQAISELYRLPNTKERRRELKHRLVDIQADMLDELQAFSHNVDIAELVETARRTFSGLTLPVALGRFAVISVPPDPSSLDTQARAAIAANPLQSMFEARILDSEGKTTHRVPGIGHDDGSGALAARIAEHEKHRRRIEVSGYIEPARRVIMVEHYINEDLLERLCAHSPFIPADRRDLFVAGFLHFFRGDMDVALHLLAPQLEQSLRQLLKSRGHDVTKIKQRTMIQEDFGLRDLFEQLRPELNAIFGEAHAAEIDRLFNDRNGPELRDRLSHGLISQWEPFGPDAIYACWFIYRLVSLPLLRSWQTIFGEAVLPPEDQLTSAA